MITAIRWMIEKLLVRCINGSGRGESTEDAEKKNLPVRSNCKQHDGPIAIPIDCTSKQASPQILDTFHVSVMEGDRAATFKNLMKCGQWHSRIPLCDMLDHWLNPRVPYIASLSWCQTTGSAYDSETIDGAALTLQTILIYGR